MALILPERQVLINCVRGVLASVHGWIKLQRLVDGSHSACWQDTGLVGVRVKEPNLLRRYG